MSITVIPAYGRDYKSAKAAKADYIAGKDFIIQAIMHPYDGKPANARDLKNESVMIRFDGLRKITQAPRVAL